MNRRRWISYGFFLAGAVNVVGIPIFSRFFTNAYLTQVDPNTFSEISLFAIILWGLAYTASASGFDRLPALSAVFALEKFFYTAVWVRWIWQHWTELAAIYRQDILTGFFYSVYGINDFLFGLLFAYAAMSAWPAVNKGTT